jgi:hypothetical protein
MKQNFQDAAGNFIDYQFQQNKNKFTCLVKQHGQWIAMAAGKTIEIALVATMTKWDNLGETA